MSKLPECNDSSFFLEQKLFTLNFFLPPLDMKANNYDVSDAGETITFKGVVQRSLSQALFLVFVTGMSMATLALVLNIQFNDLGMYQ